MAIWKMSGCYFKVMGIKNVASHMYNQYIDREIARIDGC